MPTVLIVDDQLTGYSQRPAPGWLDKPGAGLILPSTDGELIGSLTSVFPYQNKYFNTI
jgi:hypothetical protein